MPLISLILRTRNEERWIKSCLEKIASQTIQDIEVILVDNGSNDKTIQRAKAVMDGIKVVDIGQYLPGRALNEGIRNSSGEYIVCISSHCVPKHNNWLEIMLSNFNDDEKLAGVYGRQIPMHFTNSHDKRDLIVTFGLDKRVQKKDPFFHNANSMIPKKVWEQFPFDEDTTNIEDRIWAKEVLKAGYHIIYEPDAPVYHHHGIYQNRNEERLRNVIRIIGEDPEDSLSSLDNPLNEEHLEIAVIIPVREESRLDFDIQKQLLKMTVKQASSASFVDQVIVTTESKRLAELAKSYGADVPFLRPDSLSDEGIPVVDVLKFTLEHFENRGIFFDYLATMEITHPFRPKNIVELCIEHALKTGLECVLAGMPEYRPGWWLENDEYQRIDDFLKQRQEREPIHIGLPAICSVITPNLLRSGKRIGDRVGIVEITDPMAQIEIRSNKDFQSIEKFIQLMNS